MEENVKLTIPDEVKSQLKTALKRFGNFINVLDMMSKNIPGASKLAEKTKAFQTATAELLSAVEELS